MADEKTPEETTEETQAPEAAAEQAAPEAAPEAPEADAPAAADDATAQDAPAAEAVRDDAPAQDAPAAEPVPDLPPKERRAARRARTRDKAGARGPMTPEARAELRAKKAASRRAYRAKVKAKRQAAPAGEPTQQLTAPEHGPGRAKIRQGVVVSDKADKTITVRVDYARRHRRYHKILRSSTTLHVHDESNDANAGDTVRVIESRPLSRTKRWRLVEVLERAK
jgi:small subunit ribosomal protein S17